MRLAKEAMMASLMIMAFVLAISLIPFKFEFIKPIKQEFDDFDIYDLFYSGKPQESNGRKDTNVVIVQAANTRSEIRRQVEELLKLEPAVIWVDLSFNNRRADSVLVDDSLIMALSRKNVITGYSLKVNHDGPDSILEKLLPNEQYLENGGYINFTGNHSAAMVRKFAPRYGHEGGEYLSLPGRVVKQYGPGKVKGHLKRNYTR